MQAMLIALVRYMCVAILFSAMTVSALYKPAISGNNRVPQLTNIVHNLEKRSRHQYHHYGQQSQQQSIRRFVRPFKNLRNKYQRMWSDQRFADEMFRIFDRNGDNVIERDEFKSILRVLGIIRT